MKKFMSMLLALIMVMSFVPAVGMAAEATFTDVKGTEYYAESAEILAALNILTGYEDKSFGAEKTITRAEMATIICRMIEKEAEADKAKGETKFDDVTADHWATGYINTANKEGIINGYEDGSFRPENEVLYEEAVKMVVCALGLGEGIEVKPEDWSKGYLEKAKETKLTDNLKGEKGKAATRGDIAVLVKQALSYDLKAPVASVEAGTYSSTRKVTLTTATEGAEIYYTTDGSEPTVKSTKYEKEISISKTTTLKAVAVKKGVLLSDILAVEYVIKASSGGGGGGGGGGSAKTYTVTFDLNYTEEVEEEPTEVETDVEEEPSEVETNVEEDVEEEYVPNVYKTVKVNSGKKVSEPEAPEREELVFAGWAKDREGTEMFDFSSKIKADLTLYAIWKEAITVSFDLNYEGAEGAPEKQIIEDGELAVEPEMPEREGYAFVGWYTDATYSEKFSFSEEVAESVTLYARWVDIEDTTDTDGDGLTDPIEEYYGTDITLVDTDGDGLSDYLEIISLLTDPLKADSDDNGINDGDEDFDGDGITNAEEVATGTDPVLADTDGDGLNDDDELNQYGTDPVLADTDGDGVSDGKEIALGTNPLEAEESFELNVTAENEDDTVTVSVQIELSGEQVETLTVEPVEDSIFFTEEIPGYMGQAYDFNVEGEFESAIISFEFDDTTLDENAEPVIYYYNEEEQEFEALETTIEGNIASAEVTHFSKYILIDRTVFEESFTWVDIWENDETYKSAEIIFVIDDSGSLGGDYYYDPSTNTFDGGNDPEHMRLEVARDFIANLDESAKVGIVKFDMLYETLTDELVECNEDNIVALHDILQFTYKDRYEEYNIPGIFDSRGSTYMYEGIDLAYTLYSNYEATSAEDDVLRAMVVFTDGQANGYMDYYDVIDYAIDNNIKIYTVGLGTGNSLTYYFTENLQPLAENTGGKFYYASEADQLVEIYENIGDMIDVNLDSDNDNVPDYYEDNMVAFNGVRLEMDKYNPDTDGDGLEDGEEVVIKKVPNADGTQVKITGTVLSDPYDPDTDNDGIGDEEDKTRMEYSVTDKTLALVAGLSYTNLSAYVGKTVGDAIDAGEDLKGISDSDVELLRDAVVIYANNSGVGYWKDFWDSGLGSIALKINRNKGKSVIIYGLRGSEFGDDFVNDACADLVLGIGWDTQQSKKAFNEYKKISTRANCEYYIAGHSLGGRLTQDVLYKVHNANEGFLGTFDKANITVPVHSATFNALGYDWLVYKTLENDILGKYEDKLTNYYYVSDLVGEGLGTGYYQRAGVDVELYPRNIDGELLLKEKPFFRNSDYHGITYFHNDYYLQPLNYHDFDYWLKW